MAKFNWMTTEDFFKKENEYRHGLLNRDVFMNICSKYNVIGVDYGFVQPDEMKHRPNFRQILESVEKGSDKYIDHLYSFLDTKGNIFWVSCPYHFGRDRLSVKNIFDSAGIECEICDAFYANCTIIIPAKATSNLVYEYFVMPRGGKFQCVKATKYPFEIIEKMAIYDDEKSANAFIDGIVYANRSH